MLKTLNDTIKNFDLKIRKIMVNGLYFSLLISLIGTLCLICYISFKTSNLAYYIGTKIIWLSISFGSSFFASALVIDRVKKDLA